LNIHFICRHFNDLDHAIPLAVFFRKVLSKSEIEIIYHGDSFHNNLLRDNKILNLTKFKIGFKLCIEDKISIKLILLIQHNKIFSKLKIIKYLFNSIINRINNPLNYCKNYISKLSPKKDIVFFDLHIEKKFNKILIDILKKKQIKVFAFSHGLTLFSYKRRDFSKTYKQNKHPYQVYDNILLSNDFHRNFYDTKGLNKKYTISIGSPRFSYFWIKQLNLFYKTRVVNKTSKKNSILFFIEKGDSYAKGLHQKITDTKEQEKILNFLNNQNEFIVYVKMNTRGLNKNQLNYKSKYKNLCFFDNKTQSSILIDKANFIFSGGGSSIICEAFLKNKPTFLFKYLHPNHKLIYDRLGFPNIIKNFDDFIQNYYSLIIQNSKKIYVPNFKLKNFVKEYIGTDIQIEKNIKNFIKNIN
tara:strand:+ start:10733 stop:11971 length:1239 start_codon:yes stop_codon:yes gene_type:complete